VRNGLRGNFLCARVYVDDVPGIPGRAVVLRADRTSAVPFRVGHHRLRVDRRRLDPQPHRRRTDTGRQYISLEIGSNYRRGSITL